MAPKKDGRKGPRKPRFQEGDRVLCFHGPFLYKAKCMKVSVKYRKVKYRVWCFGVKRRRLVKAAVTVQPKCTQRAEGTQQAEGTLQPSSIQAPDTCQPSTSGARDSAVLAGADGWDVCVALRGRPSPQADWEEEWLPLSKLLKYSKANLRKLGKLKRAQQGRAAERPGAGPVTREKASAVQRRNEQASARTAPKARSVLRQVTRVAETGITSVGGRGRGRPPGQQPGQQPGHQRRRRRPRRRRRRQRGLRRRLRRLGLLLPMKNQSSGTAAAPSDSASDAEPDQDFLPRDEGRVPIPEPLKPWLREDRDMIVRQSQLFRLPAQKSVDSILEDYERYQSISLSADASRMRVVREVVLGLKAYFNVMLGLHLLYKFERLQYAEILASMPGVPMSQVYGAPHLLRLFVKLEEVVTHTPVEEQSLALLLPHFNSFLHYLADNFSVLFSPLEYHVAPPQYYLKAF